MTSDPSPATPIRLGDDRPALRIRRALVAAFALACFVAPSPGKSQPQPGAVTPGMGIAAPSQSVAVEIAMTRENGEIVCRPEEARLPADQELTLQLVNGTDEPILFAAPGFFEPSVIANLVGVTQDPDTGAFTVEPGATGQIVFTSDGTGEFAFGCAEVGAEVLATGTIVVAE